MDANWFSEYIAALYWVCAVLYSISKHAWISFVHCPSIYCQAFSTLCTVGYGDISPVSNAEKIFAMFAMQVLRSCIFSNNGPIWLDAHITGCRCIGGCFYGFVIANISDIVSYTNHNRSQYLKRMEEVWSDSTTDIGWLACVTTN